MIYFIFFSIRVFFLLVNYRCSFHGNCRNYVRMKMSMKSFSITFYLYVKGTFQLIFVFSNGMVQMQLCLEPMSGTSSALGTGSMQLGCVRIELLSLGTGKPRGKTVRWSTPPHRLLLGWGRPWSSILKELQMGKRPVGSCTNSVSRPLIHHPRFLLLTFVKNSYGHAMVFHLLEAKVFGVSIETIEL